MKEPEDWKSRGYTPVEWDYIKPSECGIFILWLAVLVLGLLTLWMLKGG